MDADSVSVLAGTSNGDRHDAVTTAAAALDEIRTRLEGGYVEAASGMERVAGQLQDLAVWAAESVAYVRVGLDSVVSWVGCTEAEIVSSHGEDPPDQVAACLTALKEDVEGLRHVRIAEDLTWLGTLLGGEVTRSLDRLAVFLQSHDHVLQRVDHVREMLASARAGGDASVWRGALPLCREQLQAAHSRLQSADGEVREEVVRLEALVASASKGMQVMAEAACRLEGCRRSFVRVGEVLREAHPGAAEMSARVKLSEDAAWILQVGVAEHVSVIRARLLDVYALLERLADTHLSMCSLALLAVVDVLEAEVGEAPEDPLAERIEAFPFSMQGERHLADAFIGERFGARPSLEGTAADTAPGVAEFF